MKTIDSLGDLRGKRVLVRSDFNVPLSDEDGTTVITDDGRIRAALPTLKRLTDAGARVVVMAHLGRPKGAPDPQYSLAPVAARLGEVLGQDVALAEDLVGPSATATVEALADGQVALLENVRFDARETSKVDAERAELAGELAQLADAFVSDGFGVVHRKQASVYDVAQVLPAAAGDLVLNEVESLSKATDDPERPYAVVLGGSKVSDKLGVIANLLTKADRLLIGGGMVFTFLAAKGLSVGNSLLEKDQIETVKGYLADRGGEWRRDRAAGRHRRGGLVRRGRAAPGRRRRRDPRRHHRPRHRPRVGQAVRRQAGRRQDHRLERPHGRLRVRGVRRGHQGRGAGHRRGDDGGRFSIVGGGDSAAAVRVLGFDEAGFSHISTGGGASLELLEGKTLPGLTVLAD